jgi:hypothetical protein
MLGPLADKIAAGERITAAEALKLFNSEDIGGRRKKKRQQGLLH